MAVGISNFPTSLDAASDLVEATNNASTQINMGIPGLSNTETTITVVSTLAFPSTGIIRINNELISYSAKTATTFTVQTRGFESTIAANHANGSTVSLDITAASNNAKNSAIIAIETKVGTGSSTPTANTVLRGTGTGTSAFGQVGLTTDVTGTLPVANGGTGATSLTANNVLLGNGTSAVQVVAPGTSGNVLTSNGTTWQSVAGTQGILRTSDTIVTLTASSPTNIFGINSTALQTVNLPDVTTLTVGRTFAINCESSAGVQVGHFGQEWIASLFRKQRVLCTCVSTAANAVSSWVITYDNFLVNPAGAENYLINSAFRVDQRQGGAARTLTTGNFQFVADRWQARALGANVQVSFSSAAAPGGIIFTGSTGNTGVELRQRIEQSVMNGLQNTGLNYFKTVVLSYEIYVSGASGACTFALSVPTTADNFTSVTQVATGSIAEVQALSNIQLRASSAPITVTNSRGIELVITTSAIPNGATVQISNVKLEPGFLATPYVSVPFDEEFRRCLRYYEIQRARTDTPSGVLGIASVYNAVLAHLFLAFTPKRATPTFTSGGTLELLTGPSAQGVASVGSVSTTEMTAFNGLASWAISGGVAVAAAIVRTRSGFNNPGTFTFDAEL